MTIPVRSMPSNGGNLAKEKTHPERRAKTINTIRMNMVPPGGSATEPKKSFEKKGFGSYT